MAAVKNSIETHGTPCRKISRWKQCPCMIMILHPFKCKGSICALSMCLRFPDFPQLQRSSLCPEVRSLRGVEARDDPLSVLSELELRCCCSELPLLEVAVDEEVEEERVFSLKSVMMTVTLPTVMANC